MSDQRPHTPRKIEPTGTPSEGDAGSPGYVPRRQFAQMLTVARSGLPYAGGPDDHRRYPHRDPRCRPSTPTSGRDNSHRQRRSSDTRRFCPVFRSYDDDGRAFADRTDRGNQAGTGLFANRCSARPLARICVDGTGDRRSGGGDDCRVSAGRKGSQTGGVRVRGWPATGPIRMKIRPHDDGGQTGNRSLYACGGTARIRMKLRRIVSSDPNPQSRAMRFTGRVVSPNA
jgi:hypothetical protein